MTEIVLRGNQQAAVTGINFDEVEVRRQVEERLMQPPVPLPLDPVILRDLKRQVERIVASLYQKGSKLRRLGAPEFNRSCGHLDDSFVENLPHRVIRYFDDDEKRAVKKGFVPLEKLIDEIGSTSPEINWMSVSHHFADVYEGFAGPFEMLLDRIEATLNRKAELREVQRMYQLGLLEHVSDRLDPLPTESDPYDARISVNFDDPGIKKGQGTVILDGQSYVLPLRLCVWIEGLRKQRGEQIGIPSIMKNTSKTLASELEGSEAGDLHKRLPNELKAVIHRGKSRNKGYALDLRSAPR